MNRIPYDVQPMLSEDVAIPIVTPVEVLVDLDYHAGRKQCVSYEVQRTKDGRFIHIMTMARLPKEKEIAMSFLFV